MKKRQLIALLLLCALGANLAACTSSGDPAETTDRPDTTPVEVPDNTPKSGVPEGTTFDGKTVRIMNAQYFERYLELIDAAESTGDTVSDAVYERNLAVMDKLDVNFEYTTYVEDYTESPKSVAAVRQTVLAGDQAWDILHNVEYYMKAMPGSDLLMNLNDAPYIDIDQPWWSGDYIRKANITDSERYFLTGDFSIGHINQFGAVYYNKDLYKDFYGDPDEIYDLVLGGKWTMDKLHELVEGVYRDVNGNNEADFDDVVGLARNINHYSNYHAFFGAGGTMTSYDKDGLPVLDGMNDRNVAITEKLYRLVFENAGTFNNPPKANETDYIIEKKFAEGTMLFMLNLLCGTDHLREMEDDYGIIPYPKFDESVDGYRTLIHNQSASLAIPYVTTTSDMACAVMEEMAYQGWLTMVPEYYSVALKTKYVRDSHSDKAMQIIDLIRDSASTDFAMVQSGNLSGIGMTVHNCIKGEHANFASTYAAQIDAAKVKLSEMLNGK